jgi:hypothetical protein
VHDPASGRLWGLASTDYLRKLYNSGVSLQEDDPQITDEDKLLRIGSSQNIYQLLNRLRTQHAVIVVQESDATELGHTEFCLGLFTISDLNRRQIRSILYRLLSVAELGLAQLIESEINDPWEWLPLLSEENQVRVLGYWELSKRRGVDIGPLAALTLTQLLTIAAKTERLRERIGFKSRTDIDREAGRVPEFRNRIMHPVRPLILGLEDVEMAYRAARFLEHLRNALTPNE